MADQSEKTPVLDLLTQFAAESLTASGLDAPTLMQVRLAALVASHAPPVSYELNLAAASEVGLEGEDVRDILLAIAPIVGSTRVMAALTNIERGLDLALEELVRDEEAARAAGT